MRNLVLALVLANLAFAAWHSWDAPLQPVLHAPDSALPKLTLVTEVPADLRTVGTISDSQLPQAERPASSDPTAVRPSGSGAAQEAALRKQNARDDQSNLDAVTAYVDQLENGPNTEGIGNQPLAPEELPDGTKEFKLTAKIVDWQVAPGQTVRAWTYNGMVPGPMIQVNPGDRVRVRLLNANGDSLYIANQNSATLSGICTLTGKVMVPNLDEALWPGQAVSVDLTVEVGGAGTLPRSLQATRIGGRIAVIGLLTGPGAQVDPMPILRRNLRVQGLYVGNRQMFEAMNAAISRDRLSSCRMS